jgi:hypothetical protein
MIPTGPRPKRLYVVSAMATLAFSATVLGYLIFRERAYLLAYEWQLDWRPLALALPLFGLALLLAASVWAGMMAALGSQVAARQHLRYYVISHLAKRLPGTIWYVVGRGYLYRQEGDSVRRVTAASGLEFAISVVAGTLVSTLLVLVSALALEAVYWWALLAVLAGGLGLLQPAAIHWLLRRLTVAPPDQVGYGRVLAWLGLYGAIWTIGGVILYLVIVALIPLELNQLPYVIGSWSLVGVLAATVLLLPSNLGVTEVGLSLLLSRVIPSSLAVVVVVLLRILLMVFELIAVLAVLPAAKVKAGEAP